MATAVVYSTDNKGEQVEVSRLFTDTDGKVKPAKTSSLGFYVLNRPLYDRKGRMKTKEDGDDFLELMPLAYSGQRLRVSLEMDGTKGDLPGHPFRGNQWGQGGMMAPDRDMGSGVAEQTMSPKNQK